MNSDGRRELVLVGSTRTKKTALPHQDSNLDKKIQNLLCYHYTMRQSRRGDGREFQEDRQLEKRSTKDSRIRSRCRLFSVL